jgi:hypothetical protein
VRTYIYLRGLGSISTGAALLISQLESEMRTPPSLPPPTTAMIRWMIQNSRSIYKGCHDPRFPGQEGWASRIWIRSQVTGLALPLPHGQEKADGYTQCMIGRENVKTLSRCTSSSWFVEAGVEVPFGYQAEASK